MYSVRRCSLRMASASLFCFVQSPPVLVVEGYELPAASFGNLSALANFDEKVRNSAVDTKRFT